jgi:hypothetical protein
MERTIGIAEPTSNGDFTRLHVKAADNASGENIRKSRPGGKQEID